MLTSLWSGKTLPVIVVSTILVVFWYVGSIYLNGDMQRDAFANANKTDYTLSEFIKGTWTQERPKLPAPDQILSELYKTVIDTAPTSKRSLVFHGYVTLSATLFGFLIGSVLGMILAILVVHVKSLDKSLMPWVVASQTIPIIALAPMIIVIMNQFDITGLVPKSIIAAYLSFFPVTVGMVKGLRSPDPLQLDLMRSYWASRVQIFFKLRIPASVPFLFASLKVGVAASLVGTVVAELTKSEDGGFGARLLAGSYYGQTIQIWSALFAASACAWALVTLVGILDRLVTKAMGAR
ncbi:MAG: ABC transporter permease [Alphaproteobacteria bacterium]|nr:ABC transporter permease [Alphaproteobacteria bacterium]